MELGPPELVDIAATHPQGEAPDAVQSREQETGN